MFQAGAGIHVISRIDENWLFGSLNGAEGSFPANFIDCVPANLPLRSSTVDEASTASQESAIKSVYAVVNCGCSMYLQYEFSSYLCAALKKVIYTGP